MPQGYLLRLNTDHPYHEANLPAIGPKMPKPTNLSSQASSLKNAHRCIQYENDRTQIMITYLYPHNVKFSWAREEWSLIDKVFALKAFRALSMSFQTHLPNSCVTLVYISPTTHHRPQPSSFLTKLPKPVAATIKARCISCQLTGRS